MLLIGRLLGYEKGIIKEYLNVNIMQRHKSRRLYRKYVIYIRLTFSYFL